MCAAYCFRRASWRRDSPMRPVFMRSWPRRYLATVQPLPSSCTRFSAGTLTSSKNTSFTSCAPSIRMSGRTLRSEEHTSELQSHVNLVCRLLLEKKNVDDGDLGGARIDQRGRPID